MKRIRPRCQSSTASSYHDEVAPSAMVDSWLPRYSAPLIKEGQSHPMRKSRSRRKWAVYLVLAARAVWLMISRSSANSSSFLGTEMSYGKAKHRVGRFSLLKTVEAAVGDKYSQQSTLDAWRNQKMC